MPVTVYNPRPKQQSSEVDPDVSQLRFEEKLRWGAGGLIVGFILALLPMILALVALSAA